MKAQQWLDENYSKEKRSEETSLELFENNLEGSLSLEGFSRLKILDCSENLLTDLDLTDCHKISSLSCWGNQLTSLDFLFRIRNPKKMLYINICDNNFSQEKLICFRHFENLKKLRIYSSDIEEFNEIHSHFCQSLKSYEDDGIDDIDIKDWKKRNLEKHSKLVLKDSRLKEEKIWKLEMKNRELEEELNSQREIVSKLFENFNLEELEEKYALLTGEIEEVEEKLAKRDKENEELRKELETLKKKTDPNLKISEDEYNDQFEKMMAELEISNSEVSTQDKFTTVINNYNGSFNSAGSMLIGSISSSGSSHNFGINNQLEKQLTELKIIEQVNQEQTSFQQAQIKILPK